MTKYSFVLLSGETGDFLENIRNLGVVDITRCDKPVDAASSTIMGKASEHKKAIDLLGKADYRKDNDFEKISKAASEFALPEDLTSFATTQSELLDSLKSEIAAAKQEIEVRKPWGSFDKALLDNLSSHGYSIHFHKVLLKNYEDSWEEKWAIHQVSSDKKNVWFVSIVPQGEQYDFPFPEVPAPKGDVHEAEEKLNELQQKMILAKGAMMKAAQNIGCVRDEYEKQLKDLDFYLAKAAGEAAAENTVTTFVGFAPKEENAKLSEELDKLDVFYIAEEAKEEDNPPIKLKNNWFARQFETFTGMYGMPAYGEFDPTPILAPFYLLFFGMCMGDAGYGILLILIGLILKYKMSGSGLGKMHRLVTLLGVGTLLVGLFLGTFFGINMLEASWTPSWLKSICVDGWFPGGKIAGFPVQMIFAIGIGVFHICLAMIVKTIGFTKRFGFKNTIGTWGWTLLIVGGLILITLGMMEVLGAVAMKWAVIALASVSCLGIFVFNTPGRNPLKNIGSGLWDTYNMVTGLLGDVLSYVRLYALGLAGGLLGNAFNIMGTMILDIPLPGVNWLFCIIILVFGHALNLAMSCLGAFVHPLRLTFVEYFKNSGYEGTGAAYNPLTNQKTN